MAAGRAVRRGVVVVDVFRWTRGWQGAQTVVGRQAERTGARGCRRARRRRAREGAGLAQSSGRDARRGTMERTRSRDAAAARRGGVVSGCGEGEVCDRRPRPTHQELAARPCSDSRCASRGRLGPGARAKPARHSPSARCCRRCTAHCCLLCLLCLPYLCTVATRTRCIALPPRRSTGGRRRHGASLPAGPCGRRRQPRSVDAPSMHCTLRRALHGVSGSLPRTCSVQCAVSSVQCAVSSVQRSVFTSATARPPPLPPTTRPAAQKPHHESPSERAACAGAAPPLLGAQQPTWSDHTASQMGAADAQPVRAGPMRAVGGHQGASSLVVWCSPGRSQALAAHPPPLARSGNPSERPAPSSLRPCHFSAKSPEGVEGLPLATHRARPASHLHNGP
jgi:hypothetical protein